MTNLCIHCQNTIEQSLTFSDIFYWRSLDQDTVCADCKSQFQPISVDKACPHCFKENNGCLCKDCIFWQEQYPYYIGSHRSIYRYNDFARDWMVKFKVLGDIRYGLAFGQEVKKILKSDYPNHLVVPIPSSMKSLNERGFNQIEVILSILQMEYANLLVNISEDIKQSRKDKKERLKTTQPFQLNEPFDVEGLDILLMDDIYTTGRTLYHARDILFKCGAKRVDSLSLFR